MIRILPASLLLCLVAVVGFAQKEEPDETAIVMPQGKISVAIDPGMHITPIRRVFFLPNGEHLVTLGQDHTVRLWDVESGRVVKTVHLPGVGLPDGQYGHHEWDEAVLSPDGMRLAVGARYWEKGKAVDVAYLVSLPEGKLERVLRGQNLWMTTLAFSADGKRLATASWYPPEDNLKKKKKQKEKAVIHIWDLTKEAAPTRIVRDSFGEQRTHSVAFSPDGKRLAWVYHPMGGILDLEAGNKTVAEIRGSHVIYSHDGKTIITADNHLRLYDAAGKELLVTELPIDWARSLILSPDSKTVLVNGSYLYDLAARKWISLADKRTSLISRDSKSYDGAFSSDGKYVAATGAGNLGNWLLIQEVATGLVKKEIDWSRWFARSQGVGTNWSADGKGLCWLNFTEQKSKKANRTFGTFRLDELQLEAAGKDTAQILPDPPAREKLRVKEVGKDEAVKGLRLYDILEDGKKIASLTGLYPTFVSKDRVASFASGNRQGISLHEARTGKLLSSVKTRRIILDTLVSSPDGKYLLTPFMDHTLTIWTVDPLEPLLRFYRKGQDWIIWTDQGYYDATPGGEKMLFWKVDNGIDKMPSIYTADRFKKKLHRPDVIKKAFELGSVQAALEAIDGKGAKVDEIEAILPPVAELKVLKQDGAKVTVRVTARAQAKGQPVVALRLMLNGMPFPELPAKRFDKPVAEAQHEWTVELNEGRHTLGALVRSEDASSRAEPVSVEWRQAKNLPVLHVLAVGIDKYPIGIPTLNCAAKDAAEIEGAFKKVRGDKVRIFSDVKTHLLTDGKATAKGVLATLKQVKPGREDVAVVFLAGHGTLAKGDFYFLTADSDADVKKLNGDNAISGKALAETLGGLGCRTLLLLDACHSGAANLQPASDQAARTLSDDEVGVFVLSATLGRQKAIEREGNGLFTRAIKEALEDSNKATPVPRAGDGRLFVHHLYSHAIDRVGVLSEYKQTPFLRPPDGVEPFALRQFDRK